MIKLRFKSCYLVKICEGGKSYEGDAALDLVCGSKIFNDTSKPNLFSKGLLTVHKK